MQVVFAPHFGGFGHKVRCTLLARELRRRSPEVEPIFILRRDDSMDPGTWCEFPWYRGRIGRSRAIATADCIVQDGFFWWDSRLTLSRRTGAKVVLVSTPFGFSNLADAHRALDNCDRILVAWPVPLYRDPSPLEEWRDRVEVAGAFMSVGRRERLAEGEGRILALCSRNRSTVVGRLRMIMDRLAEEFPKATLVSPDGFLPETQYYQERARADILVSQGTTAIFESMYLGIPRIEEPLLASEEQKWLARELGRLEAMPAYPSNGWTEQSLYEGLHVLLSEPDRLRGHVEVGKRLVPENGIETAAKTILGLLG